MEKSTSCGVLVFDMAGQLLLCHASDSRYWDIPKGAVEGQEEGAQTAAREAAEECGFRLSPEQLRELGLFPYRKGKDLRLFAVLVRHFEAKNCVCSSFYIDRHGRRRPEMDGFRWAAFEQLPHFCAPSLVAVLTQALSLEGIHGHLLYEVGPVDVAPGSHDFRAVDLAQGRAQPAAQE
ncbi:MULTISPECIES: NUDIX hydrolase [Variovorax]|jgi:8-oxo-dGTP pyrophosphatase MutT (NUDIX family)|uniref:NUDIX hydrolase n=1 Tax=Variovorax TaxID=34072 RepID=UPI00086E5F67|nr:MULTISPECIES: NUDIX hydrolase [Variovorax]MBN8758729.1 NUDIX hydrolase [Variovorax sp.]ODU12305.1 MAG: NTP pyrophosphohydrolase [Variovorax sp. SCN 67-85]ODV16796.1 MAG: NTP pyrophosphohydrolase [Variovorax sp. SCN 67-20]OJZ04472.1 MAG: NTP pyrophosphohydrolase [Variovorax sp. 67-131]UKI07694.1 NUDIX hydrolase [Variovorax paradoxus]